LVQSFADQAYLQAVQHLISFDPAIDDPSWHPALDAFAWFVAVAAFADVESGGRVRFLLRISGGSLLPVPAPCLISTRVVGPLPRRCWDGSSG